MLPIPGRYMHVEITPSGVSWSAAAEPSAKTNGAAAAAPKAMQRIPPPPEPAAVAIPAKEFVARSHLRGGAQGEVISVHT